MARATRSRSRVTNDALRQGPQTHPRGGTDATLNLPADAGSVEHRVDQSPRADRVTRREDFGHDPAQVAQQVVDGSPAAGDYKRIHVADAARTVSDHIPRCQRTAVDSGHRGEWRQAHVAFQQTLQQLMQCAVFDGDADVLQLADDLYIMPAPGEQVGDGEWPQVVLEPTEDNHSFANLRRTGEDLLGRHDVVLIDPADVGKRGLRAGCDDDDLRPERLHCTPVHIRFEADLDAGFADLALQILQPIAQQRLVRIERHQP